MSEDPKIYQRLAEPHARESTTKSRNYDMDDSEDDPERWRSLDPLLRDCELTVGQSYRKSDFVSRRYQIKRRSVVSTAATCGMLAVLFAITQLAYPQLPQSVQSSLYWVKHGEILAAIAAAVAVVVFGLRAALPTRWLLERERTERYRSLKFCYLIHPKIWGDAKPEVRLRWLRTQIAGIEALDKEELENWAKGEETSEAEPIEIPAGVDSETLTQLLDYYKEKRLRWQRDYFDYQASRRLFWESRTKHVPALFFFLSILAAMAHFLWDVNWREIWSCIGPEIWSCKWPELGGTLLEMDGEGGPHPETQGENSAQSTHNDQLTHHEVTIILIMFAASLPVIGAAIRTLRTAHEFGRNTLRFEATSNELNQLSGKLQDSPDQRSQLEIFQRVENVLEAERREWMRLMIDAEWYG
jgi:hypothetical protein